MSGCQSAAALCCTPLMGGCEPGEPIRLCRSRSHAYQTIFCSATHCSGITIHQKGLNHSVAIGKRTWRAAAPLTERSLLAWRRLGFYAIARLRVLTHDIPELVFNSKR